MLHGIGNGALELRMSPSLRSGDILSSAGSIAYTMQHFCMSARKMNGIVLLSLKTHSLLTSKFILIVIFDVPTHHATFF